MKSTFIRVMICLRHCIPDFIQLFTICHYIYYTANPFVLGFCFDVYVNSSQVLTHEIAGLRSVEFLFVI